MEGCRQSWLLLWGHGVIPSGVTSRIPDLKKTVGWSHLLYCWKQKITSTLLQFTKKTTLLIFYCSHSCLYASSSSTPPSNVSFVGVRSFLYIIYKKRISPWQCIGSFFLFVLLERKAFYKASKPLASSKLRLSVCMTFSLRVLQERDRYGRWGWYSHIFAPSLIQVGC